MGLFSFFTKAVDVDTPKGKGTFKQQERQAGLLVTSELDKALEECKSRVASISKLCRAKNQKFRDIDFDLENDPTICLYGLETDNPSESYAPSDVRRVTQIFNKPQFFVDGADANDIVQGGLGDCWFLSALSMMTTAQGLIEKSCVARDEVVGVYGFVFFRDSYWVSVIIDDMLFTSIPKFEELNRAEQHLYHNNKDDYNKLARRGNKTLYFAKSGTEGETWVPLIEKAYAKLHGDYGSLCGGEASEAVEDLTGGVATIIPTKDILDIDKFWHEELSKANVDRLFGCAFDSLDTARSGQADVQVNGLFGGHAYSVLRAVECRGKRFVVLRNPWGRSEWTGPWSDGSKEWTPEWLQILPELGHVFGDDGQFVMEYSDFLDAWEQIDRTLLFDDTWVMSSQWLRVEANALPSAWTYGDVSFTFTIPEGTPAIIVLSKLDDRYFDDLSGNYWWNFNFVLFKAGESEVLAESSHARLWSRSVNVELELEAGDYVVHVRLDRKHRRDSGYLYALDRENNKRKMARVQTQRAMGRSIAANVNPKTQKNHIPESLSELAGRDLKTILTERQKIEDEKAAKRAKKEQALNPQPDIIIIEAPPVPVMDAPTVVVIEDSSAPLGKVDEGVQAGDKPTDAEAKKKDEKDIGKEEESKLEEGTKAEDKGVGDEVKEKDEDGDKKDEKHADEVKAEEKPQVEDAQDKKAESDVKTSEPPTATPDGDVAEPKVAEKAKDSDADSDSESESSSAETAEEGSGDEEGSEEGDADDDDASSDSSAEHYNEDENAVFLGLRVYTNKSAPAVVNGQVRYQIENKAQQSSM
ncbi:hypothetical protein ONZ45_g8446 [Pleurotus djamor]|nr:hypothetical protein ONZ45_g8446 [Pleurotus djamor]